MFDELTRDERLLLLKFVCAFAWADLEIRDQERAFVKRLFEKLELDAEERLRVEEWLNYGVPPEEIDPNRVPRRHRETFLEYARKVVKVDGELETEEAENLKLLQQLLR